MRSTIFAAVVPFLFCGCGCPRTPTAVEPDLEPALPAEVKLPAGTGAKALDKSEEYLIFLSVNEQGKVILAPSDQLKDREGNIFTTLDTPAEVLTFLKRRAREDRDAAGPANKDKPLRSTVILRVDKNCPFEKTDGIMKACRQASYVKFQWRASRGADGEGQISVTVTEPSAKPDVEFVARANADNAGKLSQITLRGDGIEKELDLKADVDAFAKELTELAAKNKSKRTALQLQVGGNLLQADVIRLIDAAVGAGFTDVWPAPIDAAKLASYTALVTSNDRGEIANINLRGDGLPAAGLDFKADVGAFAKKLKELVAKNNDKHLKLTLELADKLLHDYVVQLLDASIRAGIEDVSPVPIDKSKR